MIHFIFLAFLISSVLSDIPVKPLEMPDRRQSFFEFHLTVEHRETMRQYIRPTYLRAPAEAPTVLYYNSTDQEYFSRSTSFNDPCDTFAKVSTIEVMENLEKKQLILGEGTHRRVIAVNGQRPGPTLVVNQGASVAVTVQNDLMAEVSQNTYITGSVLPHRITYNFTKRKWYTMYS